MQKAFNQQGQVPGVFAPVGTAAAPVGTAAAPQYSGHAQQQNPYSETPQFLTLGQAQLQAAQPQVSTITGMCVAVA